MTQSVGKTLWPRAAVRLHPSLSGAMGEVGQRRWKPFGLTSARGAAIGGRGLIFLPLGLGSSVTNLPPIGLCFKVSARRRPNKENDGI